MAGASPSLLLMSLLLLLLLLPGKCYCHWHCLGTHIHYPSQGLLRHCTSPVRREWRRGPQWGSSRRQGVGPEGGGARGITQDTEGQSPRPPRSRPRMNLGRRNVLRSSPARRRGGAHGAGRSLPFTRWPIGTRDTSPPEPPLSLHQHVKPPLY